MAVGGQPNHKSCFKQFSVVNSRAGLKANAYRRNHIYLLNIQYYYKFTVFKTQSTEGNFVIYNIKIYNKQQIFNPYPERRKRDAAARSETTILPPILVSIIGIILVLAYNLIP
jgi:hypothetical protein